MVRKLRSTGSNSAMGLEKVGKSFFFFFLVGDCFPITAFGISLAGFRGCLKADGSPDWSAKLRYDDWAHDNCIGDTHAPKKVSGESFPAVYTDGGVAPGLCPQNVHPYRKCISTRHEDSVHHLWGVNIHLGH